MSYVEHAPIIRSPEHGALCGELFLWSIEIEQEVLKGWLDKKREEPISLPRFALPAGPG
jgi:hypothetical protein